MSDTDPEHDTPVAPTDSLPTMAAPEQVQAWSEDTDEIPSRRYGPVITAGLVVVVAGIAGTVTWLAVTGFNTGPSKSGTPSAIPTTKTAVPSTPVAAPSPPPPATVTAQPPPPPTPVFSAALDQRLLANLRELDDYDITDPALVVSNAHRFCTLAAQGIPVGKAQEMVASESLNAHRVGDDVGMQTLRNSNLTASAAFDAAFSDMTTQAMIVYPHCGTL